MTTLKIGDQAPEFTYKRTQGPPKNKSYGLQDSAHAYPTHLGFKSMYKCDFVPEKSTMAPGYEKTQSVKVCREMCVCVCGMNVCTCMYVFVYDCVCVCPYM
jgi:hypothetical protein